MMSSPVNLVAMRAEYVRQQGEAYDKYIAAKGRGDVLNETYFKGVWNGFKSCIDYIDIMMPPAGASGAQSVAPAAGETPSGPKIKIKAGFADQKTVEAENAETPKAP